MELINNTIKHANASSVLLTIAYNSNFIECKYSDDGIGIGLETTSDGLGLKSIEGRVTALNGNIEFGNIKEGKGFFANMVIPV
jgi:signal transduction histidine kinase